MFISSLLFSFERVNCFSFRVKQVPATPALLSRDCLSGISRFVRGHAMVNQYPLLRGGAQGFILETVLKSSSPATVSNDQVGNNICVRGLGMNRQSDQCLVLSSSKLPPFSRRSTDPRGS